MADTKKRGLLFAVLKPRSKTEKRDEESERPSQPLQRRESTRLQSAAKLLRSFSKSKDLGDASSLSASDFGGDLDRARPRYQSEGKGGVRRRLSARASSNSNQNNNDAEEKPRKETRSHSFHGKADRKSSSRLRREVKAAISTSKCPSASVLASAASCEDLLDFSGSAVYGTLCLPEDTVAGARSILLTEDTLVALERDATAPPREPDLIQDLPGTSTPLKELQLQSGKKRSPSADRAQHQRRRRSEDSFNNGNGGHPTLRHSKSMAGVVERRDSVQALADSLLAELEASEDAGWKAAQTPVWAQTDMYSDHLRSSSYAIVQPSAAGPQSVAMMQQRHHYAQPTRPQAAYHHVQPQSLPYISSSVLVDNAATASANSIHRSPMQAKTPRTCELEEYARRYEAMSQRASSRRRHKGSVGEHSAEWRPPQWRGDVADGQSADNGRDSVSTVQTNSSSETVKYQEEVHNLDYGHEGIVGAPDSGSSSRSTAASDYASMPPRGWDLKRFPVQTYASPSKTGEEATLLRSGRKHSRGMRHNVSERQVGQGPSGEQDHMLHSKSVPNLAEEEVSGEERAFAYLDPEKRLRVTDNTLKLIQKQALLDYYERHSSNGTLKRNSTVSDDRKASTSSSSVLTSPNANDNSTSSSNGSSSGCSSHGYDVDSGFYSPTGVRSSSAGDGRPEHPPAAIEDQKQLSVEDVANDNNDCAIYDDRDLDEELDKEIAAANADENEDPTSARPVYLKECAQAFGAKKMSSSSLDAWSLGDRHQLLDLPPERPPKKPHLRSSPRLEQSSPQTPPRATPTSSRPQSRESSATPSSAASSRVATPTKRSSSARGKPKFPSPPGSPGEKTRRSPSPPPPPLPPQTTSMADRELPLPPPPAISALTPTSTSTKRRHAKGGAESPDGTESDDISGIIMAQQQTPTLRISDKDSLCSPNGCDGSYRRTSSPSICTTPNVKPSTNGVCNGISNVNSHLLAKSPAKTPKRESPATIAAKEAPGWEKFLGGKSSTILFTSAEVDKLRQQQQLIQQQQQRAKQERAPLPPPKPRASASVTARPQVLLETDLSGPSPTRMATSPDNDNICLLPPIHASKSSPSLNQSLVHGASSEYKQSDGGRQVQPPWKNSLPQLLMPSPGRHDPAPCDLWKEQSSASPHSAANGVNHNHSNSDSGLSSISGRASTMSPISTMSNASSSSCGSSSSRASLRSASIVSSCTIPLDEEDEEEEQHAESDSSSPSGTVRPGSFRHIEAGAVSAVAIHEEACNDLLRELIQGILPSDRKLAALFGVLVNTKNSMDYVKGVFDFDLSVGRARRQKKGASSPFPKTTSATQNKRNASSESHSVSEMRSRFLAAAGSPARLSEKEQQTKALREKKAALEERFCQKMEALRAEQASLKDETKANEELGRRLSAHVLQLAQPNECEKFKLHVDEIDKITSLLYGLSGRLAKAEHSLDTWPAESDADGKDQLVNKRDKLVDQMTEAKKLKENIDKRSETVAQMLRKYLPLQTFEDYVYFIQMKSRLIMEARDVQDKIAQGEEQLCALRQILV